MQRILITGFGGFIGYSLVKRLREKFEIVTFDNFSDVSNYEIKLDRAKELGVEFPETLKGNQTIQKGNITFHYADLRNTEDLERIFAANKFDIVIHLAALVGVRQSLKNPQVYIDSNVKGFVNLLECANKAAVKNVIYASSSSIYGLNDETPYTEDQKTDSPISVYAASKKANELLANVYSHLYGMNLIGLRFFTVYGPWTRPDMAAFIFMKAIMEEKPIALFNEGNMIRDFTYVDDITASISLLIDKIQTEKTPQNRIFNIGNHNPILTLDFLHLIEEAMGKKAIVTFKPVQAGDMLATNASCDELHRYTGFKPETAVAEGVKQMVKWFKQYKKQAIA
jgi:UDP-glucuronate 4-epimerase